VRWDVGATTGVVVAGTGGRGAHLDQLLRPTAVEVVDGAVYVADTGNHRVVRWDAGAATGVVVAGGTGRGAGAAQLDSPQGVAVDEQGSVWVGDTANDRVVRWPAGAATGTLVTGAVEAAIGPLVGPTAIGLAPDHLLVADTGNHRVVAVALDPAPAGLVGDVEVLTPSGPCLVVSTSGNFFRAEFGQQASGRRSTATNCGRRRILVSASVTDVVANRVRWTPVASTDTCSAGLDRFGYRLRSNLGDAFLTGTPASLAPPLAAAAERRFDHLVSLPCPGSSGRPTDATRATVIYSATDA
jgi:hypothetical protein